MGGSSKQVTGYRYFANFLLFIGNPIEKVLGINFDKRGWQTPLIDEQKNPLSIGEVKLPNLYGENEGGVAGKIHARYGTENPDPVDFYSSYLAKNDLPPLAYPYQSYLAFTGLGTPDFGGGWVGNIIDAAHGYYNNAFYLGNSGYMKEMLLWVKRIHVRNDGRPQWYDEKAEIEKIIEYGKDEEFAPSGSFVVPNSFNIPMHYYNKSYFSDGSGSHIGLGTYNANTNEIIGSIDLLVGGAASGVFDPEQYCEARYDVQIPDIAAYLTLVAEFELRKPDDQVNVICLNLIDYGIVQMDNPQVLGHRYRLTAVVAAPTNFTLQLISKVSGGVMGCFISFLRFDLVSDKRRREIEGPDINPVHKIREILTDDTAMNKPESDVNDINFMKAADRIWDEGLGISWSITEKSCLEAIEELCGHIEAGVRVNRQTGLYEMVLFRDDWFDENEIHTLAANKIKSISLEIANADEAINQLNVSYYNRDAIKDSSFSISENASIRNLNGRVNAEDADFPYFMNQRNAAVVAQWKLKQMSTPVWRGSFSTAENNARKWNRYDLLKLAWPRKWQGEITVRIMKINLGTGADVSIDFVEVTPYSSNLSSDIAIDKPIDVGVQPPLACQYEPFEMPYYLAVMALGQRQVDEELSYENNFGLVGVVAEQPQSNSLYAVMMTHDGTEGEEWVRAATINYEPIAELDQIISRTSTSFVVKDSAAILGLPIGTLIKCGSDWIGTPGEWMVFQSIDPYTGVVSVKRGALDSLPQGWGIGTKLYFCGNDVAYDSNEYVSGEEVLVSALTTTPSGMLENKGSIAVQMNSRAIRPYPPANVRINEVYWPAYIENDLNIVWSNRNRTQQTGGEILGYFDSNVTLESNTQTLLTVIEFDENNLELATHSANVTALNSYTLLESVMQADTRSLDINLKTVRDGYECMNVFNHIVKISTLIAPSNVTFEVIEY